MSANKSLGNPKLKYYCNFLIDKACIPFRGMTTNTIKMYPKLMVPIICPSVE